MVAVDPGPIHRPVVPKLRAIPSTATCAAPAGDRGEPSTEHTAWPETEPVAADELHVAFTVGASAAVEDGYHPAAEAGLLKPERRCRSSDSRAGAMGRTGARTRTLCIGGGPAGLTAAYLLSRAGHPVTVLERDVASLGGISRTVDYEGCLCDVGGHRFFSKSPEVNRLWEELLDEGFIERPRKSRIHYRGRFFDYPLKAGDALRKLGVAESALCVLSYLKALALPHRHPANFEEWVVNRFGRRLFDIFFKTYTEKVWGMPCGEISADWAAQRIRGLSLWTALKHALLPGSGQGQETVKTLIGAFRYPRKGPGMMWESAGRKIEAQGGRIVMDREVVRLARREGGWEADARDRQGARTTYGADAVVSSAALRDLVACIDPPPPAEVRAAAQGLRYRDFLIVGLVVDDRREGFDDQWLYIHDPDVQVGRIQNFKAWSPDMVPDDGTLCLGMEYFCFEGDGLWTSGDAALVEKAGRELVRLGLARSGEIRDGFVIRQEKAYPIYDEGYAERVETIRRYVEAECPGLHPVGRNGMHKYNNQDHAMMTAMLAAENVMAGERKYDVWKVNADAEYHEEGGATVQGGRLVPERARASG